MSNITNDQIRQSHNDYNGEMGLPPWATDQKCVSCNEPLEPSAIRGIALCTNARYLGDISVDICCTKCSAGYEMHYQVNCTSLGDFIKHLQSASMPIAVVPDFKIENWENNLVSNILRDRKSKEIQENKENK